MSDDFVCVFDGPLVAAELAAGALRLGGLRPQVLSSFQGQGHGPPRGRVMVVAAAADEAKAILREFDEP
jgi:hypothetical protein